jgi:hypothetical protein
MEKKWCAKFCHFLPALTIRRRWSYQNAQSFLNGSKVHRESMISRLSMDTSYLLKELCISRGVRVTYPFTEGGQVWSSPRVDVRNVADGDVNRCFCCTCTGCLREERPTCRSTCAL